jgi:putative Mg2+ transporter-C (MgtC) family protein
MADLDMFLKILVGALLGFVVGTERELSGQPAGIRTFTLVAVGSTLFTVIAIHAFGTTADAPSRIVANILTGVGFLGGGLIFRQAGSTQGLTTAAGIWAMAAVGVAVGSDHYLVAVLTSALILVVFSIRRMGFVQRLFARGGSPEAG